ncbi:phosphotransferase [Deinococcus sp. KNUC1210]|uniref:phosphotransferase n=1 Tax=Deinococcus sp. KNUC1210 TaxID=2917691 RepID=UPI001EF13EB7|nr:phosphotransferase [Deinococcus sp. KNUC1210]ULH16617.1 phosphotransferase [Deinococcus sp. KNUC1210]
MTRLLREAGISGSITGLDRLTGGYANDLYRARLSGSVASVVVRCWRRDPAQAATELAVMQRAAGVVPLASMLAADMSAERPVALLEDVPDMNAQQALEADPAASEQLGEALGQVFARLHRIQFDHPGLFSAPPLRAVPWPPSLPSRQLLDFAHPRLWNDTARAALGEAVQQQWWEQLRQNAPLLDVLADEASLVHADANPKNVMVRRSERGWQVTAVLDWEFAFSGSSLSDLGNLLRWEALEGPSWTTGVLRGWHEGGGPVPGQFLTLARTLDVYSLLAFVNSPESALHGPVTELIRRTVTTAQRS